MIRLTIGMPTTKNIIFPPCWEWQCCSTQRTQQPSKKANFGPFHYQTRIFEGCHSKHRYMQCELSWDYRLLWRVSFSMGHTACLVNRTDEESTLTIPTVVGPTNIDEETRWLFRSMWGATIKAIFSTSPLWCGPINIDEETQLTAPLL